MPAPYTALTVSWFPHALCIYCKQNSFLMHFPHPRESKTSNPLRIKNFWKLSLVQGYVLQMQFLDKFYFPPNFKCFWAPHLLYYPFPIYVIICFGVGIGKCSLRGHRNLASNPSWVNMGKSTNFSKHASHLENGSEVAEEALLGLITAKHLAHRQALTHSKQ